MLSVCMAAVNVSTSPSPTVDGPAAGPYHKGSARMFESALLEKLSHVHPATPALLFLPVMAASLWVAIARDHTPAPALAGLLDRVLLAAGGQPDPTARREAGAR